MRYEIYPYKKDFIKLFYILYTREGESYAVVY